MTSNCCHGIDDVCVGSGCIMGVPGGEHPVNSTCRRCDGTGFIGRDWPAGAGRRTCPSCRGCGVEQ